MQIDLDDLNPVFYKDADYICFGESGFHLYFHSYILSVQIGYNNYCANKDYGRDFYDYPTECYNAEIAIWRRYPTEKDMNKWGGAKFLGIGNDTVAGYVRGSTIAEIIPLIRDMRVKTRYQTMRKIRSILFRYEE